MTPEVTLFPQFVAAPHELFVRLQDETVWDERMRARKTASFGVAYNYSGIAYPDVPMPPYLAKLAERIAATVGHPVSNCLLNFYPDGLSTMGFHSDATESLHPASTVAVVSLGAHRKLTFRPKAERHQRVDYELVSGSLLVMAPSVQRDWQHALPAAEGALPRISLTFRHVIAQAPVGQEPQRLLFTVEDTFLISGRGLILAPGVAGSERTRIGDRLVLKRPDGTQVESIVAGIEMLCPTPRQDGHPILLKGIAKQEVPSGTTVWTPADGLAK